MSTSLNGRPFRVLLVENNPYDRAVLDACFEADPEASLQYTVVDEDGTVRAVTPGDLWNLCADDEQAPDLVLLDLALTKECEEALANHDYRAFLREKNQNLREADYVLSGWCHAVRPLLVNATLALARLERAEGPVGREKVTEQLVRLVDTYSKQGHAKERCEEQRAQILGEIGAVIAGRQGPREILNKLWRHAFVAETVLALAKAPSMLRIFACVAAFSNRCFGVVSHYADEDTRLALRIILGFRNRCADERQLDDLLNQLILNKSALYLDNGGTRTTLTAGLRRAHSLWVLHQSPEAVVAPYGALPVVTPENQVFELWECVDKIWPRAILSGRTGGSSTVSTVVLWDETRFVVGREDAWRARPVDGSGHLGWKAILNKDIPSLQGTDVVSLEQFPSERPEGRPVCYVVQQSITDPDRATRFALHVRTEFPALPRTLVFLGGSPQARGAFMNGLAGSDAVSLYRIPAWNDEIWSSSWWRSFRARWLGTRTHDNGRRKGEVVSRLVEAFWTHRIAVGGSTSLAAMLKEAPEPPIARKAVARLAQAITESEDPLDKWILLEMNAGQVLDRLGTEEELEAVLIKLKFLKEADSGLSTASVVAVSEQE